jgi:hypothetical protein
VAERYGASAAWLTCGVLTTLATVALLLVRARGR